MSAGRVHVKASLILAAGFSVGALVSQDVRLLECTAGALTGILLSPDLDVDAGNISNRIIKDNAEMVVRKVFFLKRPNRFSKAVGWLSEKTWRYFWLDYAKSFKHGAHASHAPVYSTLARLFYIYYKLILIPHVLIFLLFNPPWSLISVLSFYFTMMFRLMFLFGLIGSDVIHYFLDILTTESTK